MIADVPRTNYGVEVIHAWGMTEMSPLGTLGTHEAGVRRPRPARTQLDVQAKQGHPPFGVEMKITDDDGNAPAVGRQDLRPAEGARARRSPRALLQGRGRRASSTPTASSTPATSRTIDAHGYMQITDRAKDVIKSGGEWISSIDLENLAVGHPDVAEAAVIGVPHPKWDERPLLVVVLKPGADRRPSDEILDFMRRQDRQVVDARRRRRSSTRSRTPRPARSRRRRCASSSRTTCCRPPRRRGDTAHSGRHARA